MRYVLLDGPMGTELARRGASLESPGWSAHALESAPGVVAAIHRDYVAAGATVHTANTFRTTPRAVGTRWTALLRRAVDIARSSVPAGHRVAGSIAPVEDCYRPDLSPGAGARSAHRELARALAGEGVDLILCETFPSGAEAAVAVEAAARTGLPTWVALTAGPCASLMTPAEMARAARDCHEAGAAAVLVGCTAADRTLAFLLEIAPLGTTLGAYANAGDPAAGLGWGAAALPSADEGAARYARLAESWAGAGATILGGCCGTGPDHIARLRAALQ
ncbi:MAG TPA: homocysteine S-methyltransferase family protein [Polyangiaceae bacterium]|nr:homocysteine S-methyltransferase family protein [Polyangiaceae bacterium]